MNHKKELLRGLWVSHTSAPAGAKTVTGAGARGAAAGSGEGPARSRL